jgi:hypothetical protein
LVPDPKKIGVEQFPGSKLDSTRTVFTIRTRGRSPLKEGDTIQVGVREASSRDMSTGVSYYDVFIQTPSKATLIVGVANADTDQVTSKSSVLLTRVANLAGAALQNPLTFLVTLAGIVFIVKAAAGIGSQPARLPELALRTGRKK